MSGEISWDAPSRFGAAGRLGRAALRRALRPVLVRQQAVDGALRTRLAEQERALAALGAGCRQSLSGAGDLGDLQYRVDVLDRRHELAPARSLLAGVPLPADGERLKAVGHEWGPDEQPRVLCCGATGDLASLLDVAGVTLVPYARRHRWDLVLSRGHLAGDRPAAWNKIALVRELLRDYPLVGWLDSDTVIVDDRTDIGTELDDNHDFYLVAQADGVPRAEVVNSGVFLVRATDWAERFLDAVWEQEDLIDHRFWENAAIMRLLGWDLNVEPLRPGPPTAWRDRVKLIDPRWNNIPYWGRAEQPRINHYGALAVPRRRLMMLDDVTTAVVRRRSSDPTAHVTSREDLPVMFNRLGLIAVGAEISVQAGNYSAWILHRWSGTKLISIDPWAAEAADAYADVANVEQRRHDELHAATTHRLAPFGPRSEIWRMTGAEAALHVGDASLDFVYIDARHTEEDLAEDLALWEPKVRPGGVIAGHDYFDGVVPEGDFGVKTAVDKYFWARGWPVHETVTDRPWSSWWVLKP